MFGLIKKASCFPTPRDGKSTVFNNLVLKVITLFPLFLVASIFSDASEPSHGFAYFGTLKYSVEMRHFDYVNPTAKKGGVMRGGDVMTFNNLNPLADKGILAVYADSLVFEPLMMQSEDEIASYYGRLAKTIEVADDYSWVEYTLKTNARWHDGIPVTVEDIIWTFQTLKNHGSPGWRNQYREISEIEQTDKWSFRFHFSEAAKKDQRLVQLTTGFTPAAKHYWQGKEIQATTLTPPLGNGPYRITEVKKGQKIVYQRVTDYWGIDLPVNKGYFNFDRIEFICFLDQNVMRQSLRAGVFDYYREQVESALATAYDFDAYKQGLFKKETYQMGHAYGMHQALILNQRKPLFQEIKVREALSLAYHFEWANKIYWHDALERNNSYFARSPMEAMDLPSADELKVLEPFRKAVPKRVFTHRPVLPKSKKSGRNRENLLRADELLKEAGWIIKDLHRVNEITGEPMIIEFVVSRGDQERMVTPYVDNLKRLGITAVIKKVESTLLTSRKRTYDYDILVGKIYTFNLPYPSRMRNQFSSRSAQEPNMLNYGGIQNPVVDALIDQITNSQSEAELSAAGRALDRVLFWNFFVIPDGHPRGRHLVYWDRFGHPPLGKQFMKWTGWPYLWWFDEKKSARVDIGLGLLSDGRIESEGRSEQAP